MVLDGASCKTGFEGALCEWFRVPLETTVNEDVDGALLDGRVVWELIGVKFVAVEVDVDGKEEEGATGGGLDVVVG